MTTTEADYELACTVYDMGADMLGGESGIDMADDLIKAKNGNLAAALRSLQLAMTHRDPKRYVELLILRQGRPE
jgi:hypothetical protein